ncbi:MAG: hypothetical protein IT442_16670 [Phycisphaeraceae bacterium]|nr:hypothetical protein [Phycisphaeraceae bacterium]
MAYQSPILSNDAIEESLGRPLTWWEELGMWWYRETTPQPGDYEGPASIGLGDAIMGGLGDVTEWTADTAIGKVGATIGKNAVDTAETTADVIATVTKPSWLLVIAVVLLAWWAGPWAIRQTKALKAEVA